MEEHIIPVESIQERDVDLILLEELSVDNGFCEWLVNEANIPVLTKPIGAWRSITGYGLGETDILFSYISETKKVFVLIENKLDASFQDEQFTRYVKRAEKYEEDNSCDEARTLLIAPEMYCENQSDFENFVTYENIAKRLEFTGTKRNVFKSNLLKIASEKLRRGYNPINSIVVQIFQNLISRTVMDTLLLFGISKSIFA